MNATDFVFLDLETTGLDPERDSILEIAILIASPDLKETCSFVEQVHHPLVWGDHRDLIPSDFVCDMHTKSGLLEDCKKGRDLGGCELGALRFLHDSADKRGPLTLAGFSVHFDRSFLRRHMPALERRFSHRHIDVSVLKQLRDRWEPSEAPKIEPVHRALADCRQALDELRRHRHRFGP